MEAASTIAPAAMPQHMQALAHANRVRLARAALKRAIAAGDVDAAEIVRECPWEVETMTVGELLRSQRRWGRTRARKFLFSLAAEREPRARRGSPSASARARGRARAPKDCQAPPAGLQASRRPASTRGGRQAPAPPSFQRLSAA